MSLRMPRGDGWAAGVPAAAPAPGPEIKVKVVVVDSRDRDRNAYPTPDRYTVELPEDIFDVVSMRLVAADVPLNAYVANARNASVPFAVGGGATSLASVEPGDYDAPGDLAAMLSAALTAAAGGAAAFTVAHPATRGGDGFAVFATAPFELRFSGAGAGASLARVLGFDEGADYASAATPAGFLPPGMTAPAPPHLVRAPFRKDLSHDRYVVLNINDADVVQSAKNETNRAFAVLPSKFIDLNLDNETDHEKRWTTPIARFSKVSIEFTDYYGAPYDFQNQEHRIDLQLEYMPNRKYSFA